LATEARGTFLKAASLEFTAFFEENFAADIIALDLNSYLATMPPSKMNGTGSGSNTAALEKQKVDRFGFIVNIDSRGKIQAVDDNDKGDEVDKGPNAKRMERREKKWNNMVQSWDTTNKRRQRLILNRLRKGLPDTLRGTVWPLLGNVKNKLREKQGLYQNLLNQCEQDNMYMDNPLGQMPPEGPNQSTKLEINTRTQSFQNIQETIERDIHRTYPRHSLFYDEENHRDDIPQQHELEHAESAELSAEDDDSHHDLGKSLGALCTEDFSALVKELEGGSDNDEKKKKKKKKGSSDALGGNSSHHNNRKSEKCETIVEAKGGQAALRRVLCAYSYYDREVGYCQGMNFIAGMFITIMSEEEAFWMLVGRYFEFGAKWWLCRR
jgi:hypothetical protein